ncbi:MAG: ECF-type sigma factor, partial [Acidobacteriota bacterium]
VDRRRVQWRNRAHFFGFAVQTMRRILVDHARRSKAEKRGSGAAPVMIDDIDAAVSPDVGVDLLALDSALEELAHRSERQARVVELKFFGGLQLEEIAEALDVSPVTVSRDWTVARAWLRSHLRP